MSYTSHAEQTIQVMATRDLIQNSILEQNELKQRGILKDIQHQEPFPPKTTFFIKQDVDLNGELSMYYIMNPQINSLLLFKFYTETPATFHLVPHTQRLYSLISPKHHEPLHIYMHWTHKRVWSLCSTVGPKNEFNGEKEAKSGWPTEYISWYLDKTFS